VLVFNLLSDVCVFDETIQTIAFHQIYAAEWGGLVWVFTPGNQTGAGLVSVWVSPGPVWTGSGFAGSDPVN
jgi:hypothetical protein